MTAQRLTLMLVAAIFGIQAASLYREYFPPKRAPANPVREIGNGVSLDLANLPTLGRSDATIVLAEFSDYECPYCARHATSVGLSLKKQFIDTGKMRAVFANNPLPSHPQAKMLASAAICAGAQGRYWEMHDVLFQAMPKKKEDVVFQAKVVGLSEPMFTECIGKSQSEQIERDLEQGKKLEIRGTPAFVVGLAEPGNKMKVMRIITGAVPLDVFEGVIRDVERLGSRGAD